MSSYGGIPERHSHGCAFGDGPLGKQTFLIQSRTGIETNTPKTRTVCSQGGMEVVRVEKLSIRGEKHNTIQNSF